MHISVSQLGFSLEPSHTIEDGQAGRLCATADGEGMVAVRQSLSTPGALSLHCVPDWKGASAHRGLKMLLGLCHPVCCPAQKAGAGESSRKLELCFIFQSDASPLLPVPSNTKVYGTGCRHINSIHSQDSALRLGDLSLSSLSLSLQPFFQ